MHFEDSSNVTLLFHFWDVHGPAGMVLSVFLVLLLTVFYELLKVWKIWLGEGPVSPPAPPPSSTESLGSSTALGSGPPLESSLSESSLTPPDRDPTHKKKLADAHPADVRPRRPGDARLPADAVRHVLQRLDLPGGHRGLPDRLLPGLPSPGKILREEMEMERERDRDTPLFPRWSLTIAFSRL
ncbi:probable low affinity copper uptake protein 2 isoform X1 [Anguilla anguilla]|uniref:probable low affinity copper uptake protein 2 isoform X1 n=1 Tax=Anguilla anguilla TaxID=7936 RepID=UPI0015AA580B|nr:probable low affinity copper uptake protein 2 isoform X1 [Anguilla anguilla]